jgi:hypothetical protein
MPTIKTIVEMRQDCECEHIKYCPLQELVLHFNSSDRLFTQHKCVEKFRVIESEKIKRELSWKDAYIEWVNSGYAQTFAEQYKEGIKLTELYKLIFKT